MIGEIPDPRTEEDFLQMTDWINQIFKMCVEVQNKANGKIKVGCIVEAMEFREGYEPTFTFEGCNIHVSDSFGDTHAERMAIDQALKEKCFPITVYVTSTSQDENVLLCGSCRHYISEINENCNIVVFNPDGSIKSVSTIKKAYPNHKNVIEKNKSFLKYCIANEIWVKNSK